MKSPIFDRQHCTLLNTSTNESFSDLCTYSLSDTGSLIATGARSILQALNSNEINVTHPAVMLHDLSETLQKNMGGSLGALLCIFLQASAAAVHSDENGMQFWLSAIKLGMSAVQKYGLAEFGDRTMLDALQYGVERLEFKIGENASLVETIEEFVAGCEQGANNTIDMVPKSGRAAYAFSEGKIVKAVANDPGKKTHVSTSFTRQLFYVTLYVSGAQVIAIIAAAAYEGIKTAFKHYEES